MSIATQVSRIQTDRNTIRAKLVELGLASNVDNLDKLAAVIENIINRGAVSLTVREGETVTIPAGYHNGSGTVSGVAGGGNYTLQSKTATPTKKQQNVTPDAGYYGLSDVTIAAIPDAYQDVTSVTAAAGDVLTGKVFVTSTGVVTTGTMANNGAVAKTLSATVIEYTIPSGYHNGEGKVTITLEAKTVTPTKSTQTVTPTSGKVLSSVTVNPIPDNYADIDGVTAAPEDVLAGSFFVNDQGELKEGTMPNNATTNKILTPDDPTFTIPKGYHDGSGNVSIDPENVGVTPTNETQAIRPSTGKVLGEVTVAPIPAPYYDVSGTTLIASDVLEGESYVDAEGDLQVGTMPDNGAVSEKLTDEVTSYTVPAGYHNGEGKVIILLEQQQVTPTKSQQDVYATEGYVMGVVHVDPIPDEYQDVSGVTAAANTVLAGSTFVDSEGNEVEGEIQSYGADYNIDGLTQASFTVPEGFHSGSTVSLTDDIEQALAAI